MSELLQIKKYPNRRFYDTTRSCHVTLRDIHDLVRSGHDVSILDVKSGEDITNLVLIQILVEKDQPKLDLFPSTFFHMLIRTNRQMLRDTFNRFFGPFTQVVAASQKQFDSYLRQASHSGIPNPMEWATRMMQAFVPGSGANGAADAGFSDDVDEPEPEAASADAEAVEDLRGQVRSLQEQLRRLQQADRDAGKRS